MAGDSIQVEILEDGTIKVTTDPISPANHVSAEELMAAIAALCGGEVARVKRGDAHAHTHHHHHEDQGAG